MNRPPYSALLSAIALTVLVGGGSALAAREDAGDDLYLSAGFTPDPRTVDLVLDARIDASTVSAPDCHGFVASEQPDVALYYNAGPFPLILSASAEQDMTLIVNAPDGEWYCDDDSGSGLNPSIRFGEPASGNYDIWVGRHIGPGPATARLSISELYSE
ncbi:peptidase S1 [Maricaulis sp.]|uniref:peptidase S1 n=1 Tax=Maricaulis sp. TaxID=1486257 RepID=UPI0025F6A555|nr:peptidase S1 [Maricaulis sp.]MDF1769783.1 peptidase S1 [Maricaulis sp.]